jgi:hypothetical protein
VGQERRPGHGGARDGVGGPASPHGCLNTLVSGQKKRVFFEARPRWRVFREGELGSGEGWFGGALEASCRTLT